MSEYIVDVADAAVDDATGMPFMVMELHRGEQLGEHLQRVGRVDPADALTVRQQTVLALDTTRPDCGICRTEPQRCWD